MFDHLNRRRFIQALAATVALQHSASSLLAQDSQPIKLSLKLPTAPTGPAVPSDFIGLSYEVMQLEDPTFFSAKNIGLVKQFRALSPNGVLRLGGNTSEFSWWKATPSDAAPVRPAGVADSGEPPPSTLYAVTPEAIRELKSFLDATNWSCIYGLNLGYGTPTVDVAEATYVFNTLGKRLAYFQIGNEVDMFGRHLRDKKTWNAGTYLENWLSIARPVQKALPSATFGLPDVASDVTWLPQVAELWKSVTDRPHVTTLSHHYYFGGGPANPKVNIGAILSPDPKVARHASIAKPAANSMNARLRMTEGNTCYQGGKPGVSDVLASALWSANYIFNLMQLGYSGVNLHGGSGHAVAVSVGGTLRGEQLMADPNAPHAKPFYTPIANIGTMAGAGNSGKLGPDYRLQPVGYGMKFAGYFSGATMVPVELHATNAASTPPVTQGAALPDAYPGVAAFAARRSDGKVLVAILNKTEKDSFSIDLPSFQTLATLSGTALNLPEVQLDTNAAKASRTTLTVPPHTGKLLLLEHA